MKLDKKEYIDRPEFEAEEVANIVLDTQIKWSFESVWRVAKRWNVNKWIMYFHGFFSSNQVPPDSELERNYINCIYQTWWETPVIGIYDEELEVWRFA